MHDIGERLGPNGSFITHGIGNRPKLRRRHRNKFSIGSVDAIHAQQPPTGTAILFAGCERFALAATDERINVNSLAGGRICHVRSQFGDDADRFVTKNQTRLAARTVAEKSVNVRATNSGRGNFQQNFPWPRARRGHFLHLHALFSSQHQRLHSSVAHAFLGFLA